MCPSERGPPTVTGLFSSSATKRPATQNYDNTTLAVAQVLGDGKRQKTRAFSELHSYYLFAEKVHQSLRSGSSVPSLTKPQHPRYVDPILRPSTVRHDRGDS